MYNDYHFIVLKEAIRATFTGKWPVGKHRDGKMWLRKLLPAYFSVNWKLTVQNRNVWRQKLREARARILAVAP
jgi:hypothetical protein